MFNHIKSALVHLNVEEVARYQPELLTQDVLIDLMAELQAWRTMNVDQYIDTPEETVDYIEGLEEQAGQCNNEDHSNFDDYKEFFDDVMRVMADEHHCKWWHAEPWDKDFKQAVFDAICYCEETEGE